jgi:flagellar basal body-associated protein FliL
MNSRESIIIFVAAVLIAGGAAGAYFYMTQELHRVPASSLAVLPTSNSQPAPANNATPATNPRISVTPTRPANSEGIFGETGGKNNNNNIVIF